MSRRAQTAKAGSAAPVDAGPAPVEGGPTEEFVIERASASPVLAQPRSRERKPLSPSVSQASAPAPRVIVPLDAMQRWFHGVITHPDGVAAALVDAAVRPPRWRDASTDGLIRTRTDLGAEERLGVYHYAYRARLVDCLADDYPAVRHALGAERFERLCGEVIRRRPSRKPNLNLYGKALLDHCLEPRAAVPHLAFVRELAGLEWAMTEVFHAQAAPTLSIEALRLIPMERWSSASFTPSATVRVLRSEYPVNRYLQAFRRDQDPAIPARAWSATAVYRTGFRLSRMDLTKPMAGLLDRLFAGQTLGTALDALPADSDVSQVMRWFTEWVSGGFFATVSA